MNHALKFHNGALVTFVNKAKCSDRKTFICGHCLRRHFLLDSNVRELSNYVSVLRLMLKKKQKENCSPVKLKHQKKNVQTEQEVTSKFTELLKVSKHHSKETRLTIQQIQPSEVSAFAEEPGLTFRYQSKCLYASTRTYDPAVIIPNRNLEKFYEDSISNNEENLVTSNVTRKILSNANTRKTEHNSGFKSKPQGGNQNSVKSSKQNSKPKNHLDILKILPLSDIKIIKLPKRILSDSNIKLKPLDYESKNLLKPFLKPSASIRSNNKNQVVQALSDESWQTFQNIINTKEVHHDTISKETIFFQLVNSYIDVCVQNNMMSDALKFLHICRKKLMWRQTYRTSEIVEIYNTLLHGYSFQGDWGVIKLITSWMDADQVNFNAQTYAALLDCLGRVNKKIFTNEEQWKKEVINTLKKLYHSNYNANELFTKTVLTTHKRENILKTIREVLPNFEIEPLRIRLNSDCALTKDLFKENNPLQPPIQMSPETIEKYIEEQLLVEKNFNVQVKSVSCKRHRPWSKQREIEFAQLNAKWKDNIQEGFKRKLKVLKVARSNSPSNFNLYPFLTCLPAEKYVEVMMQTVQTLLEYSGLYSPGTCILYTLLGDKIFRRYVTQKKINAGVCEKTEKLFKKYTSWYVDPVEPAKNSRQEWQILTQDLMEGQMGIKLIKWPQEVKSAIGKLLYEVIIKNVKISLPKQSSGGSKSVPAFYLMLRYKTGKATEELKCHPVLAKLFRSVGYEYLNFDADLIPMVCPPKPWIGVTQGGYLMLPTDFVRRPESKYGKIVDFKKVREQQLYPTFDSLNALQAVPWIVNEPVLDVMLEVFKNGGSEEMNIPKLPPTDPVKINVTPEMTAAQRRKEFQNRMAIVRERHNEYGLWCEALYRLSLANHFRKRVFWLPQNFDFRGRVYPIPPHLNHLGADEFRSLLLFAKGKPLGPNGLNWLKIHTINLTGTHKRRPVAERLKHANEMLPEILDSAKNPLTGNKWWLKSEEPWQTLAACMEIKKALDRPRPELFVSNFPIHQDGSCNGLQHYAALGRDSIGAHSVNLAPSEDPQDVYNVVVQIIEKERMEDEKNGVEIAKILNGFVKRKVVKQTIMTTVYGVTAFGAKLQIARQLEDIRDFPKEHVWKAAIYLTNKTFCSLRQMFTSAKEIQDWLIQCAGIICKKKNYVQWISPMGLPIIQPYTKLKSRENSNEFYPNSMKQKNAFPPNFVHSLDSCHMMLTCLYCEQAGLTFASIHDCFWTHANTVDTMNKICREQFILLHSHSLLKDLSKFFIEVYVNQNSDIDSEALKIFQAVPKTGDFDLASVLKSVYFFS